MLKTPTPIGKSLYLLPLISLLSATPTWAAEPLNAIVNSNQDSVQADAQLTLREAIALTNGTLSLAQLSPAEKAQVEPSASPRITFNLPPTQTTIALSTSLPDITSTVVIDGTTQPGYDPNNAIGDGEWRIPTPIVTLTPAASVNVLRGLTIAADNVTVRGLSLYGFTMPHRRTASLPPADIFITDRQNQPSQGTVIENNWLGIAPNESASDSMRSAFGINIFNGKDTVIRNNAIANHDGSGIITGIQATNTQISHNRIESNGKAGMPDAIRLEGVINNTQVTSNWIAGNAGSGIFLFKPEGSVMIQNNTIQFNGRRLRRSAIYLTGSGHQVSNNVITDQPGAGVVVGATPRSDRNMITQNRFARLAGLSVDLNAQLNGSVEAFQRGDGINRRRNSGNRRLETGNAAINAPEFLSPEFFILDGKVNLDGKADPGSQIELYRVNESGSQYGILSEPIATTETNVEGRFSFTLELPAGEVLSAIATHPRYGTSEPARNVTIRNLR
jgi:parallel beta-helix repeat protein